MGEEEGGKGDYSRERGKKKGEEHGRREGWKFESFFPPPPTLLRKRKGVEVIDRGMGREGERVLQAEPRTNSVVYKKSAPFSFLRLCPQFLNRRLPALPPFFVNKPLLLPLLHMLSSPLTGARRGVRFTLPLVRDSLVPTFLPPSIVPPRMDKGDEGNWEGKFFGNGLLDSSISPISNAPSENFA